MPYPYQPALGCIRQVPALSTALPDGTVAISSVLRGRNQVPAILEPRHHGVRSLGTGFQPEAAF